MPILYNIDQGNDDTYLYNLKLDSNHRVIVTNKFIKYSLFSLEAVICLIT